MPGGFRCPGCGRGVGASGIIPTVWGCQDCFNRLPLELQRRYRKANLDFVSGTSEPVGPLRAEIEEWWKANPPAPVEPQVPAWKRHKQKGQ